MSPEVSGMTPSNERKKPCQPYILSPKDSSKMKVNKDIYR